MCGITGIISRNPLRPQHIEAIRRANAAMIHRGPDGAGEYLASANGRAIELRKHDDIDTVTDATPAKAGSFADSTNRGLQGVDTLAEYLDQNPAHMFMAMRRLAIIDLQGGWQPLYNEDRSIALVANGEIYNYIELRAQLQAKGHVFRTGSDCETIAHLYEEYGLDFVQHLRGMFAIALWDMRKQKLILVRDRMGEKPLYVRWDEDKIFFASEMKAMLATGMVKFELEPFSIHQYMHYGWVPEPDTMVKGVQKLSPGHMMVVDMSSWSVADHTYWDFSDAAPVGGDPKILIRNELETIIDQQLRADVPVGIALSGGVDSSLIAALAARRKPGMVHAFSVGYSGRPGQDERKLAKEFADSIGMPFHEIEISVEEQVSFFPELQKCRDDPINDVAGHGYYVLSKFARSNGFPVLLQGQGGDELFWGYSWVARAVKYSMKKMQGESISLFDILADNFPRGMSRPHLVQLVFLLGGLFAGWRKLRPSRKAPECQLIFYDINDTYQIGEVAANRAYTKSFCRAVGDRKVSELFQLEHPWEHVDIIIMRLLCRSYLLQNGIAQGDRLSMSNSVEMRLPLVDYKLVELVVGLQKVSSSYLLGAKEQLKQSILDVVPSEIRNRVKRGFNPPVKLWTDSIRARYGAHLRDGYLVNASILTNSAAMHMAKSHSRLGIWDDLFSKCIRLESWARAMSAVARVESIVMGV